MTLQLPLSPPQYGLKANASLTAGPPSFWLLAFKQKVLRFQILPTAWGVTTVAKESHEDVSKRGKGDLSQPTQAFSNLTETFTDMFLDSLGRWYYYQDCIFLKGFSFLGKPIERCGGQPHEGIAHFAPSSWTARRGSTEQERGSRQLAPETLSPSPPSPHLLSLGGRWNSGA